MGADNWTVCPECRKAVDKRNDKRLRQPGLKYGKVTPDEYAAFIREATNLEEYANSLREDYEIGIVVIVALR